MTLGGKPVSFAGLNNHPDLPNSYPRELPSLTSLRAFAALLVFVFHLGQWGLPLHAGYIGYVGVAFFYVLSGFVLTWGATLQSGTAQFYFRRVVRIFPSHLSIWLLVLLLPLLLVPPAPVQVFTNAFLIQAWYPDSTLVYSMNGVAWSLSCELAFYLLFPVFVRLASQVSLKTSWITVGFLYGCANLLVLLASRSFGPQDQFFVFASTNPIVRLPEFLIGIVLAISVRAGMKVRVLPAALILVCSTIGLLLFPDKPAGSTWAAPVFALGIAIAARKDISGRSWLGAKWPTYAGRLSFAFYLVHQLVIVNLNRYLGGSYVNSIVALFVSVLAAILLHHLVELPSHRYLTRHLGGGKLLQAKKRSGD